MATWEGPPSDTSALYTQPKVHGLSLNFELRNLIQRYRPPSLWRRMLMACTVVGILMLLAGSVPSGAQPIRIDTTEEEIGEEEIDEELYVPAPPDEEAPADTLPLPDASPAIVRYDSSDVKLREAPEETLEEYRSDNDFVYDRVPPDSESIWEKFLRWFYSIFRKLFSSSEDEAGFWAWVFRAIAVGAVVYVILKLAQTDLRSIFLSPKARPASTFAEVDENIHEMNFETLIEESVAAGNYRRAVRLLYLRALKELTDQGLLDWRRDKTNHDYLRELRDSHLRGTFADATWLFEYVWYGDVPVNESIYRTIRETFDGLRTNSVRTS